MHTFQQVIHALYVALTEAAGPSALRVANKVLRDAIAEGLIDDPRAISVLEPLAHDEDDTPEVQITRADYAWWDQIKRLNRSTH